MVTTDTFSTFGRRIASTQGFPYVVIADTPNPIQDLAPDELRRRAEAMIATVVDGLTLPVTEIERRLNALARQQIHPVGLARSAAPV